MNFKNKILKILLFTIILIIISVCTVMYAEKLKTVLNQVHNELDKTQIESKKDQ